MGGKHILLSLIFALSLASALSIISPQNITYDCITSLVFEITVQANSTSVVYSLDGEANESMQNDSATHFYANASGLSDGPHLVEFYAGYNGTIEKNESFFTILLDTAVPSIILSSPSNGSSREENVSLTYSPSDDHGLSWCALYVNGSMLDNQTSPGNESYDYTISENGVYYWSVTCSDICSNVADSETWWFEGTIVPDGEAPSVTISYPENGERYQEVDELEVKATDDSASTLECKYQIDSGDWEDFTLTNDTESSISLSNIDEDGSHKIRVNCSDGTLSAQVISSFKIDNDPPEDVSIEINEGDATTESREVTLTLDSGDANECRLSNDNSKWSSWDDAEDGKKDYTLTSGTGTKVIYYQCRDRADNRVTVSDSITFTQCGNNQIDEGEVCDGTDVKAGYTCTSDCKYEYKEKTDENDPPKSSPPQGIPKEESYLLTLTPTRHDTGEILADMFNNSIEVFKFSKEVLPLLKLNAEVKKEDGPTISLTGTYSGEKELEDLVVIFTIPKSFASTSSKITVTTAAEVTVLEEDPVYAVNFKNVQPGTSFSATFKTGSSFSLSTVKDDLEDPGVLARVKGTEVPSVLQSPPVEKEERVVGRTKELLANPSNVTVNTTEEPGLSLATGAIVLGGAALIVSTLFIVLVVMALLLLFYWRKP